MLRLIMLMTVLLLTASSSIGQGFAFGLKGGLNFANIDVADNNIGDISASSKTGYHIGVFSKLILTEKFGIQPEIYYSLQGSELTVSSVKNVLSTNYLQIPLLIQFNPSAFLNIHAGPQIGILLEAKNKAAGVATDVKDNLKNGDFAIAVGAGLDLPIGLSLTLRYVKGLSYVYEISDSEKSNMFQVSIGYQLLGL